MQKEVERELRMVMRVLNSTDGKKSHGSREGETIGKTFYGQVDFNFRRNSPTHRMTIPRLPRHRRLRWCGRRSSFLAEMFCFYFICC